MSPNAVVCAHAPMHMCVCVRVHMCIYKHVCVCVCMRMHVCARERVCPYVDRERRKEGWRKGGAWWLWGSSFIMEDRRKCPHAGQPWQHARAKATPQRSSICWPGVWRPTYRGNHPDDVRPQPEDRPKTSPSASCPCRHPIKAATHPSSGGRSIRHNWGSGTQQRLKMPQLNELHVMVVDAAARGYRGGTGWVAFVDMFPGGVDRCRGLDWCDY